MISETELVEKVASHHKHVDKKQIDLACDFSKKAHVSQKRASGDPYYYHPLEVANILADMKLDHVSVITGLLHDTVEDTTATLEEISELFGEDVMTLVDGVTKLTKIEYQSEHTKQAENFRKLLVAMSEDIRVLLVKLADRLHNMRTLHYVKSPEKRKRIAHETMEIYAPLAERIGMQQMKNELQDLAFAELYPEVRESIVSRLEYLREQGTILIDAINGDIQKELRRHGIKNVTMFGREKNPCSIWRKMEHKGISFEQISDIMAFRIITEDVDSCYRVLGAIHQSFKMIPGRFKDFISLPKDNGYQSLHTLVIGPKQHPVEMQIRTQDMHEVAEMGVAAHWSYKQDRDYSTDGKQYKWIRELLNILEHASDAEEFMENTKLEMHYDQVFCFTPRGDLVALPKGATTVDFAYEVHSSVGNHCVGAKVNSRIVPLRTILDNGDQVEIITSQSQVPSPTWESFVVTGKAKSEVRRFVRGRRREEYMKLGRSLIEKAVKDVGGVYHQDILKKAMKVLGPKSTNELLGAVGEGRIPISEVIKAVYPDSKAAQRMGKRKNPLSLFRLNRNKPRKEKSDTSAIHLEGMIPGMAMYFAECCHPIPGDNIVGVVMPGKGMTIHTSDCEALAGFSSMPERFVDVAWGKGGQEQTFTGRIHAVLVHESGSLASLAEIVAQYGGNISNLKIMNRATDFFEIVIDIGVKGVDQLGRIIAALRSLEAVQSVERHKQGDT